MAGRVRRLHSDSRAEDAAGGRPVPAAAPLAGVPVASWKKFGDDQAGNLAALIAYYAFVALFPLLLVLVDRAQHRAAATTRAAASSVLDSGARPVPGHRGPAEAACARAAARPGPRWSSGSILTFLGARGVAGAAQNALNTVWGVPFARPAGFPWDLIRELSLILVVGIGQIVTVILSGMARRDGERDHGLGGQIATIARPCCSTWGCSGPGSGSPPPGQIATGTMRLGAFIAAGAWQMLQLPAPTGRAQPGPQLVSVRRVRPGARPAGLALPAGPVHPVRGRG